MTHQPPTSRTFASPVVEAKSWLAGLSFGPDRPLIDAGQAAPAEAPPEALRRHMADLVLTDTSAHLYGAVLGLAPLREALAANISFTYGGAVSPSQLAITSGANHAFCAALASLAAPGDEVMLPTPWYFNHKMWLDMANVTTLPLPCGANLLPDPEQAAALLTDRTRAIVLVSPNNPTGAEYPPALLDAFRELARARGIALILDETYRDFTATPGAPHGLFADPDWDDTLIHIYSFSKTYRLTGHRVGALACSPSRLAEIEKFIDTVTICPTPLGQKAALWGLENLSQWVASQRDEVLARQSAMRDAAPLLADSGWHLRGLGGFFAWIEHPFDTDATKVAKALTREAAVLALPGTFFTPDGDATGRGALRFAFANLDAPRIGQMAARLAEFKGP
ncbi:aminotransferase [Oceanicola sp. 502str15]|uniref:aminotransferase n=1 Tax=Oceanicola sp. 502str15 TaxID=2696061 RepID=UPI002094E312|nr:aminotransferase [Oceanicola sp. 502str15]MCO6381632.1 aminotransferase [Oceanicola sp. 502str15]